MNSTPRSPEEQQLQEEKFLKNTRVNERYRVPEYVRAVFSNIQNPTDLQEYYDLYDAIIEKGRFETLEELLNFIANFMNIRIGKSSDYYTLDSIIGVFHQLNLDLDKVDDCIVEMVRPYVNFLGTEQGEYIGGIFPTPQSPIERYIHRLVVTKDPVLFAIIQTKLNIKL